MCVRSVQRAHLSVPHCDWPRLQTMFLVWSNKKYNRQCWRKSGVFSNKNQIWRCRLASYLGRGCCVLIHLVSYIIAFFAAYFAILPSSLVYWLCKLFRVLILQSTVQLCKCGGCCSSNVFATRHTSPIGSSNCCLSRHVLWLLQWISWSQRGHCCAEDWPRSNCAYSQKRNAWYRLNRAGQRNLSASSSDHLQMRKGCC